MRFIHRGGSGGRRRWLLAVGGVVAVTAMALAIATAFGIVSGSPSNFESNDGNMVKDGSTANDWATVDGTCTASTSSCTSGAFVHLADSTSSTDDSLTPGQKQDTECPDTTGHGNPNKDDFTDIASYTETQSSSPFHTFLYGATIRNAANGSASENVEFKSGANGLCANSPTLLARTAGDKMLAIDYTVGGTQVAFNVLTWIETSAGFDPTPGTNPADDIAGTCFVGNDNPPCWSSTVTQPSSNAAEGLTNQSAITAANNSISGQALVANKFAEFGIDLVAAGIIPPNTCSTIAQTVWQSRSSGSSFVSSTKDISIEDKDISNCGSITIIKQTDPRGVNQKFSFTTNIADRSDAGGVAEPDCSATPAGQTATTGIKSGKFCLNDTGNSGKTLGSDAPSQNSTGNTVTAGSLFPGTYTVTEGANPAGFAFDSVTCKVNGTTTDLNSGTKTVTVNLGFNDVVVCIYKNQQQLGAIQVLKTSSKAAHTALAGAHFRICTNGTDGAAPPATCTAAKTGSDDLGPTDASGHVCIDNVPFGDYYVSEKSAPTGYAADDTNAHKVTVSTNGAKCDDATFGGQTITFRDTPLTNLTLTVSSVVSGGTKSAVKCVDSSNANVGNSPKPTGVDFNDITTYGDPVTVQADSTHGGALTPGTYTCTVVVDP